MKTIFCHSTATDRWQKQSHEFCIVLEKNSSQKNFPRNVQFFYYNRLFLSECECVKLYPAKNKKNKNNFTFFGFKKSLKIFFPRQKVSKNDYLKKILILEPDPINFGQFSLFHFISIFAKVFFSFSLSADVEQ